MTKGISIHVGVNKADPEFRMTELNACVNDAEAMRQIAIAHNFDAQPVLADKNATFQAVKDAIKAANTPPLKSGDILLFTFSGHGSFAFREDDEDDGRDETILLHDCILIDNYIRRNLWSQFDEGVRILGVADCCHGGSVLSDFSFHRLMAFLKASFASIATAIMRNVAASPARLEPRFKDLTEHDRERIMETTRKRPKDIHKQIEEELASEGKDPKATILALAACNDREKALDGVDENDNSAFTKAMLEVLGLREPDPPLPPPNNPPIKYDELIMRTSAQLLAKQITTQHPIISPDHPDPAFLGQVPFTI